MADPDLAATLHRLLGVASAARQAGRESDALLAFEQIVELVPDHALALNALGMKALGDRAFVRARDFFQRAATADPTAGALWLNVAAAARGQGDDASERGALDRALALDQRNITALIRLAELHERRGEAADATQRWSSVLAAARLMPDRAPALEPVLDHAADYIAARTHHFAASVDAAIAVEHGALDRAQRRRVETAIDAVLGRRQIFTNTCSGVHIPFLPADEYFDRTLFPWLAQIEAETGAIRAEFEAIFATGQGFAPYVAMEPGTPENLWTSLDGSSDWSALHLWRHGVRDEALCARCPRTAAALARLPLAALPGRAPTAFFSVLAPHAHIPPHTGVSNMRATIHLPLIVPAGCRFRVGGEVREWRVGEAFAFDDTIEHEAWNNSGELRAMLIFDAWNPYLTSDERGLLATFFRAADRERDLGLDIRSAD